jgi:hypothetical protein
MRVFFHGIDLPQQEKVEKSMLNDLMFAGHSGCIKFLIAVF